MSSHTPFYSWLPWRSRPLIFECLVGMRRSIIARPFSFVLFFCRMLPWRNLAILLRQSSQNTCLQSRDRNLASTSVALGGWDDRQQDLQCHQNLPVSLTDHSSFTSPDPVTLSPSPSFSLVVFTYFSMVVGTSCCFDIIEIERKIFWAFRAIVTRWNIKRLVLLPMTWEWTAW